MKSSSVQWAEPGGQSFSLLVAVGGDNTLLDRSGPVGAELAAEASNMSRQEIADLLWEGTSDITTDKIFQLVPTSVFVESKNQGA